MLLCRQCILDAENELHVWAVIDNPAIDKQTRAVNHGKVKDLDFRSDTVLPHARRKLVDQRRGIFVDDRREIH